MTYGWALLIVLVALGALAFFGVLRLDTVLPEACILGTGFGCPTFSAHSTGDGNQQYLTMQIANNLGQDLELFAVEIGKESDSSSELCGGYWGGIIGDFSGGSFSLLFPQNDVRPLRSVSALAPFVFNGLHCKDLSAPPVNCCSYMNTVLQLGYFVPTQTVPLCSVTSCNNPGPSLPEHVLKVGERLGADLTIYYKPVGSAIVHKRTQGTLRTYVNAI